MPRRLFLLPTLILGLGLTPADAQEPNLSSQSDTATGAATRLVLAHRVFRAAIDGGDPVLLLTATRLARGVTKRPAPSWTRTSSNAGEVPADLEQDGPPDPANPAVLEVLQRLAIDDPDLQDLAYDLGAQVPHGRLPVASVAKSGLSGGAEEIWRLPLSGAVAAEIAVIGDGGTPLGLTVTDDTGTVVCAQAAALDPALCRFTPARNGFFTVSITNQGPVWNSYLLVGN